VAVLLGNPTTLAGKEVTQWVEKGNGAEQEYIHGGSAGRFMFDAPLEELAKQEDVLTAKYGTKRLEFRPDPLTFEGNPFSLESFGSLIMLGFLTWLAAYYIDRRFIVRKTTTNTKTQLN
jgi:AraC family transcriptional activator FtrA